ncbi:hypothetical protein BGZ60DRAFT_535786 [Tricladium varicosporioides]|nr:hypothetical protein BGZ60DRAFT_535786 [Hymenoscyphus varicosporioides]
MSLFLRSMTAAPNHDAEIISICVIFPLLALLATIARFVSLRIRHAYLMIEDYLLAAAWVLAAFNSGFTAGAINYMGLGRHTKDLSAEKLTFIPKVYFAANIVQGTTLALSKISILIMLWRIFITRKFRITVYILGIIVLSWWAACTLAGIFLCMPIEKSWNPAVRGACGNFQALVLIGPLPWVLTDFAILIAPLPVIKQLQIRNKVKIGLYAMFSFGILTCIITTIRYAMIFYPPVDLPWDLTMLAVMNIVECNITIICVALLACRPVMKSLVETKIISGLRSLVSRRGRKSRNDSRGEPWRITAPTTLGIESEDSELNLRDISFRPSIAGSQT